MEIAGETLAEFDAGKLCLDPSAGAKLKLSVLGGLNAALEVQSVWTAIGVQAQFHWPAVLNRHSEAATLMLHTGDSATSVQGLIQISDKNHVPCDQSIRGPLSYVSFVEVAPWNKGGTAKRRYRGLGALMIASVSALGRSTGNGLVGLHSLEAALPFYLGLGFQPVDCLNEYRELYLELPESEASVLRKHYGVAT